MAAAKIYLTVPFAQKDDAKALGARWDAAQKKWYVLEDKDLSLFSQWQVTSAETGRVNSQKVLSPTSTSTAANNKAGAVTLAQHKDFVAYNGDLPPWH